VCRVNVTNLPKTQHPTAWRRQDRLTWKIKQHPSGDPSGRGRLSSKGGARWAIGASSVVGTRIRAGLGVGSDKPPSACVMLNLDAVSANSGKMPSQCVSGRNPGLPAKRYALTAHSARYRASSAPDLGTVFVTRPSSLTTCYRQLAMDVQRFSGICEEQSLRCARSRWTMSMRRHALAPSVFAAPCVGRSHFVCSYSPLVVTTSGMRTRGGNTFFSYACQNNAIA